MSNSGTVNGSANKWISRRFRSECRSYYLPRPLAPHQAGADEIVTTIRPVAERPSRTARLT
ncbi:hypothetical protein A5636_01270 [Mycobacterium asiaticum]|uniref:Uncharacterized protein n=1 Tax=Mycobacterium asiaticum TaxID=1790 RepID=A0A1A3MXU6_MYCAS|nr:hypothetical protein A5636_01270 [Mycobacterium asiaticum]